MGRRGPAPTPTDILNLRGSWRANVNANEPQPEKGSPERPEWLSEYAAAAWDQLAPELEAMGVLTIIDGHALAVLCQTWGRWRKADEFLQKHGETYTVRDDMGRVRLVKRFPQVAIASDCARALNRLFQEFGLTPSARSRITVHGSQDDSFDKRSYLKLG